MSKVERALDMIGKLNMTPKDHAQLLDSLIAYSEINRIPTRYQRDLRSLAKYAADKSAESTQILAKDFMALHVAESTVERIIGRIEGCAMTARGEPLIEGLQNFGPDLAKAATQLKLVADRMGYSVDGNHPEFGRHIADILGAISEVMTGHGDAAIKEVLVSANEALKALENIKIDFRPGPKTDETTVQIRATVMSGVEERMNREGGSRRDNIQAFLDDLAVKPRKTELELAILATVNGFPDPIPNIEQWFKRSRRIKRNRRTKSTN